MPPAKRRKCVDSPASIMRPTVKCGAQTEGKRRAAALSGQYTGPKAKRDKAIADGDPGKEGGEQGVVISPLLSDVL